MFNNVMFSINFRNTREGKRERSRDRKRDRGEREIYI